MTPYTRNFLHFPGPITQELQMVGRTEAVEKVPCRSVAYLYDPAMLKPPRNPVWSTDELILALDLYVKMGGNPTAKDDAALEALSAILNKMHRLNGNGGSNTLRNRNGVYLKVMNFRSSDPAYLDQGKVGMQRGNRLEGVLWAEYADRAS